MDYFEFSCSVWSFGVVTWQVGLEECVEAILEMKWFVKATFEGSEFRLFTAISQTSKYIAGRLSVVAQWVYNFGCGDDRAV